jgi:glucose/arabinose dehydrogenase
MAFATDAPGMKHQISMQALPKPYATPAVDNSSETAARPNGWRPQVPKGFAISLYASGLSDPRWMALAPNGDVFLAEPDAGKITLLRGGKASTFATGFERPHGLAFHDGTLYVGDLNAVWKLAYKTGAMKAGARTRITTQSFGGKEGHNTRDIALAPDGTLYVAIGSAGNVETDDPPTRASVQKVDAGGTLSTFAGGLRNPVAIVFQPGTNHMWVTVNERDGLGDDLPPDYAAHVQAGGFYGWPYAYIGPHPNPSYVLRIEAARSCGEDKDAGRAVPGALRAVGPRVLRRLAVSGRLQGRRLRGLPRFVEFRKAARLQVGAGSLRRR